MRPDLRAALVAACRRQAVEGIRTKSWFTSCLLVVRLSKEDTERDAIVRCDVRWHLLRRTCVRLLFGEKTLFWRTCISRGTLGTAFSISPVLWRYPTQRRKGCPLGAKAPFRSREPLEHREMMLWVEMRLLNAAHRRTINRFLKVSGVGFGCSAVSVAIIDSLKPQPGSRELRRMEALSAKRAKQAERRDGQGPRQLGDVLA